MARREMVPAIEKALRHAAEAEDRAKAAHDAGVAEGKASERALEMFVVRSLAHEVEGGDDKTAEQHAVDALAKAQPIVSGQAPETGENGAKK